MEYKQIKEDVENFKIIASEEGLLGYRFIAPLLLELCLKEKGINASVVLGYLIMDDTYWVLHFWNKLEMEGEIKQIDICPHLAPNSGHTIQYTLVLKEKWKTILSTEKDQKAHDNIVRAYNAYKDRGAIWWLEILKEKNPTDHRTAWKKVSERAKLLKTFENIEKYIKYA